MPQLPERADYVIVGGGSAGCVLANRLSADPRRHVLLIEAGVDHAPGVEPDAIADSFPRAATPDNLWPEMLVERVAGEPLRPYEQARVIGGGSSVMGMIALRGAPDDYDEWRAAGAIGWGWDDVLPYFRKLERDLDFAGPLHGGDGPVPIRRHPPESWPPFCRAVTAALAEHGLPPVADLNGAFEDGVGAVPMSNSATRRVSAAMAYLPVEVRARPNLHIAGGREVSAVLLRDGRASGVRIGRGDGAETVAAGEVILAAGAIHSPALLLASGIGPGAALAAAGIAPAVDRPGVGANLQNHPLLAISAHLRRAAVQPAALRLPLYNCVRFSSEVERCVPGDMFLSIVNKTALHAVGTRIGGLMLSVYKSYSRGTVALDPARPGGRPRVRFNLLSDPRDLARMLAGIRLAAELLASAPVRAVARDGFVATNGALIQRLARGDRLSEAMSAAAALLLDGPAALRRRLIARAGTPLAALIADEAALTRFLLESTMAAGHVCGTARIGAADDPAAVVDPRLRVIGVERLRVADNSVMPTIVRANTNIPAIMIGEKAADLILAD